MHIQPIVRIGVIIIVFISPVIHLGITIWRFGGLPADRTSENIGLDVLLPLPSRAVLFLDRDTILFNVIYVRYVENVRSDVVVLHTSRLRSSEYPELVKHRFPGIEFHHDARDPLSDLISRQYELRPIYATSPMPVGKGYSWIPYGLTFRLIRDDELPDISAVIQENDAVWKTLNNPARGILSRYNHLMLSDARAVYAAARIAYGDTLRRAGKFAEARMQYEQAIVLESDIETSTAYIARGVNELAQNNCDAAISDFTSARKTGMSTDYSVILLQGITYRDCYGDTPSAQPFFDEYQRLSKQLETPLGK